jgi:adenosylmethionine-8-amino-7-oxononanoate aminotransferase
MKLIHPFSQPKDEHPKVKEMNGHFLVGENQQWYDLSGGTGCNIFGFTQPEIQAKVAETSFQFPNDDWTTKSTVWYELEDTLKKVLPNTYTGFIPALTGSDSVDNSLKIAWRYWTKKEQSRRRTVLVRKGSFHSGSITGWQMTDDQDWILGNWPHIDFVDFFDDNFDAMFTKHKDTLAGIMLDTVNWYNGISEVSDEVLEKIQTARKQTGCLLIVDEILTGMWRMGHFSHSIHKNLNPDMICFGKALTGGFGTLAITVLHKNIHDTISAFDPSLWDNFPIAVGNTRAQSNTGARATIETINKCIEEDIGTKVINDVVPFVERIANILKQVDTFEVTHSNSILYCNFVNNYDNDQCKMLSTFLNSHKLWNSEHTRIWFLSFYDLNKQEADYIEHTFQKFVTLVNNGKIWDQNNWKSN